MTARRFIQTSKCSS